MVGKYRFFPQISLCAPCFFPADLVPLSAFGAVGKSVPPEIFSHAPQICRQGCHLTFPLHDVDDGG
jgi:hypothetical protein